MSDEVKTQSVNIPNDITIKKCQCDEPICHTYAISFGAFYQGCGWEKEEAEEICKRLNEYPYLVRQVEDLKVRIEELEGDLAQMTVIACVHGQEMDLKPKFKRGDKVRFIQPFTDEGSPVANYYADEGDTGVISRVDDDSCYMSIDGLELPTYSKGFGHGTEVHEFWAPLSVLELIDKD